MVASGPGVGVGVDVDDLARAVRAAAWPELFIGVRAVRDVPLHPDEQCLYAGVVDSVRRATSTGRLLAREVLRNMGVAPSAILRNAGGAPAFPIGVSGSIAHDDEVAVCVAAAGVGARLGVGVDVEPALPLPAEIIGDVVCGAEERAFVAEDGLRARAIFSSKEAVYKACFPGQGAFFEFADVFLTRVEHKETHDRDPMLVMSFATSTDAIVSVRTLLGPRIVAMARAVSLPPLRNGRPGSRLR